MASLGSQAISRGAMPAIPSAHSAVSLCKDQNLRLSDGHGWHVCTCSAPQHLPRIAAVMEAQIDLAYDAARLHTTGAVFGELAVEAFSSSIHASTVSLDLLVVLLQL